MQESTGWLERPLMRMMPQQTATGQPPKVGHVRMKWPEAGVQMTSVQGMHGYTSTTPLALAAGCLRYGLHTVSTRAILQNFWRASCPCRAIISSWCALLHTQRSQVIVIFSLALSRPKGKE